MVAQAVGLTGPTDRPKREPASKEDTTSIPIPGTPFRLTAEGRLHVAVDLQELLTNQGIPGQLAQRLMAQKDPEAVAKVLLNALYLQSQGKLQNGPGYIRAGIEDGYDLLPKWPADWKSAAAKWKTNFGRSRLSSSKRARRASKPPKKPPSPMCSNSLDAEELDRLVEQALGLLPEPIVRRNPTLSNPFVRGKVYELACGEPVD